MRYPDVMTFRLTRAQKEQLDRIKDRTGVSIGVLMRRAVDWIIAEDARRDEEITSQGGAIG